MRSTLTEYLRDRVRSLKAEYPEEPIGREQVEAWRAQWRASVLDFGNGPVDVRVARSFVRVYGKRALVDLKYASNIGELQVQPWATV